MAEGVPQHIAIIMDGNGRWAKQRGKIRSAGHAAGAKQLPKVVEACINAGVKYLTVYAFSTENWKRPAQEVNYLMSLIPRFCKHEVPNAKKNGVRIRIIGRMHDMPASTQKDLEYAMRETAEGARFTLTICLSYGGRAEIVDAVNAILADKSRGDEPITEASFEKYLYAPDIPAPDLMIRTGGEKRLSNFLLWELSYAELYVTDTLWPDFDKDALQAGIDAFANRNRRFGNV